MCVYVCVFFLRGARRAREGARARARARKRGAARARGQGGRRGGGGGSSLAATASATAGVGRVVFSVDGVDICSDVLPPYGCPWDTSVAGSGQHFVEATVFDVGGRRTWVDFYVTVDSGAGPACSPQEDAGVAEAAVSDSAPLDAADETPPSEGGPVDATAAIRDAEKDLPPIGAEPEQKSESGWRL